MFLGSTVCLAERQAAEGPVSQVGDASLCPGCWGDSEGFLEAVTLGRTLKGRIIHSLNEYL